MKMFVILQDVPHVCVYGCVCWHACVHVHLSMHVLLFIHVSVFACAYICTFVYPYMCFVAEYLVSAE